jgi:hypothetical protein
MNITVVEQNQSLTVVQTTTTVEIAPFDIGANAIPRTIGEAKGDLIGFSAASTPVRIPKGSDGQVVAYDSAQTSGLGPLSLAGAIGAKQIVANFGDGAVVIPAGTKFGLPWKLGAITIDEWEIVELGGISAYIEFLVCEETYANAPADTPDDIVGIHLGKTRPKLVGAIANKATTDWNDKGIAHDNHMVLIASGQLGTLAFTGSGLNDMVHGLRSMFTLGSDITYRVKIDGTGSPNTFTWSDDGGSTWDASGVSITGADQLLNNGVYIRFGATTGHTLNDYWQWTCKAITAKQVALGMLATIV